jgi:hypothetical protein
MASPRPEHYRPDGATIQPIDLIEAQQLNFAAGNVIKYVCRAPHKGEEVEDLTKAQFYLDRLLAAAVEKKARAEKGPKA